MKSKGPKMEPCGTPQFKQQTEDLSPQNTTAWVLSVRNDVIQWRIIPPMPKDDCSRRSRMSWSTVSNAALRSRSPTSETSPESAAIKDVGHHLQKAALSWVTRSVGRLQDWHQFASFQMISDLPTDQPLNHLGYECEVRDWPVILWFIIAGRKLVAY